MSNAETKPTPTDPRPARAVLDSWLRRVHAIQLWCQRLQDVPRGTTLVGYQVNGQLLIAIYHDNGGFEVMVPACDKLEIDRTLDEAALRLGVEGCAGLL